MKRLALVAILSFAGFVNLAFAEDWPFVVKHAFELDGMCRGGGVEDLDAVCALRDKQFLAANKAGWCYGKKGQSGNQMEWHKCGPGSLKDPGAETIPATSTPAPIEFAATLGKLSEPLCGHGYCTQFIIDSADLVARLNASNCGGCKLPLGELYQVSERYSEVESKEAGADKNGSPTVRAKTVYVFCSKTEPQMWEFVHFPLKPGEDGNDHWLHNFIRPANDLVWSEYAFTQMYMAACHNYLEGRNKMPLKAIAHKVGYKENTEEEALGHAEPDLGFASPFEFFNAISVHHGD